jgi:FlaA1/EpsC-like NDP-sugar epimerase
MFSERSGLARRNRRLIVDLIHATLAAVAFAASFLLRFEFTLAPPYTRMLAVSLPLAVAVKLAVFRAFGLRDLAWRYLGFADLLRIAASNVAASAAAALLPWAVIGRAFPGTPFPRSIYVIDLLAASALLASAHAAAKALADARHARTAPRHLPATPRQRVAIYGAGQAGALLLGEIRANPQLGFDAVGFFDDDALKRSLRIHGVRVLGGLEVLPAAVRKRRIETVLIALPQATGGQITAILEQCRAARVPAKRVPALEDLAVNGAVLARQIRDVRIEDLLGRRPVELEAPEIRAGLQGRVALVTGAGGSIGAELCRQIALHVPAALIGFDHSETALYEIDREMRARFPALAFHPEIGSIRDPRRLEEVFREHSPDSVYHAAAYKHVPLMESQVFEALENNVFGTRNVAQTAAEFGAGDFVLISSDKAVRPANVMGASKRLAEMVVQSMAAAATAPGRASATAGRTRFMAVRFGNVLGSSGSVIPAFRQQIAAGGPITVTHPEMRRFFMTVPEAAQLVLEAAAMGRGGEIFALEMGEPVRILDLARKMALLSGLQPGRDIRIEFSGIRPGEKLYEELSACEESTRPTPHSQIRIFSGLPLPAGQLTRSLENLRLAMSEGDAEGVLLHLKVLVPGYNPSDFLLRRVLRRACEGRSQGALA